MVEKEAETLQGLINSVIFAFARNGIGYGDSFARVYPKKGVGVRTLFVMKQSIHP